MTQIQKLFLIIYAFLIIYLPDLSVFFPYLQPSLIIIFFFIINILVLNKKLIHYFMQLKLSKYIILWILLSAYVVIRNIQFQFNYVDWISNIIFPVHLINFVALIIYYEKVYKFKSNFFDFLLKIGLIQAIISFIMVVVPPFKSLANYLYTGGEDLSIRIAGITESRIYGIGSGYTVTLPFIQALFAVFALQLYYKSKKIRYIIYSILLIASSLLNNRTGFIIYLIIFVVYIIRLCLYNVNAKSIIVGIISLVFLSSSFLVISRFSFIKERVDWLFLAINQIWNYITTGTRESNLELLFGDQFSLPKGYDLIFGIGKRPFETLTMMPYYNFQSDIGYINDLFKGGLFYTVPLYLSTFYLIIRRIKDNFLAISLTIFLLIANYKAEMINGSMIMILIFIVFMYETYRMKIHKKVPGII